VFEANDAKFGISTVGIIMRWVILWEKRQRAAALQDASRGTGRMETRHAFWSNGVNWQAGNYYF
jgi:hypothetical protein